MRLLSLILIPLLAAISLAQEPALPKSATQPMILPAQASKVDGKDILTIKRMDYKIQSVTKDAIVCVPVKKVVDGKEITVEETRTQKVTYSVSIPSGWTPVKIETSTPGVNFFDTKGKSVKPEDVLKKLQKETPVLVAVEGPIDPYYLSTTKEDTLIIVLPSQLLYPPQKPVTPIPSPKEKGPSPAKDPAPPK